MAGSKSYSMRAKRALAELGASPSWTPEQVEHRLRETDPRVADVYASVLGHEFIGNAAVVDALVKKRAGTITRGTAEVEVGQTCRALFDAGLLHARNHVTGNGSASIQYKRCKSPLLVPEVWPRAAYGSKKKDSNGDGRRSEQVGEATPEQCVVRMGRLLTVMERSMDTRLNSMIGTLSKMQQEHRSNIEELRTLAEETRTKATTSGELQADMQKMMDRLQSVMQH